MPHPVVYIEIPAGSPQAVGDFYKTIFGWDLELVPGFNFLHFHVEGGPGGAFMDVGGGFWAGAGPTSPLLYLATDDIEGDLAKVEANGGQVLASKTAIPGRGWFGLFRDPQGNHIGLVTLIERS